MKLCVNRQNLLELGTRGETETRGIQVFSIRYADGHGKTRNVFYEKLKILVPAMPGQELKIKN